MPHHAARLRNYLIGPATGQKVIRVLPVVLNLWIQEAQRRPITDFSGGFHMLAIHILDPDWVVASANTTAIAPLPGSCDQAELPEIDRPASV